MSENKVTSQCAPEASTTPVTVRLRFKKTGNLQYISHLDLQRTFLRILTRANLPLWYTQGFNPHPKLVFALPLSIGCESVCELADVRLVGDVDTSEVLQKLRRASVPSLEFTDCYIPKTSFSDIALAKYTIFIECASAPAMAEKIERVLSTPPLEIVKKTKTGEKTLDLTELLRDFSVCPSDEGCHIDILCAAGNEQNLNPELLVEALKKKLLLLRNEEEYGVIRTDVCTSDANSFE